MKISVSLVVGLAMISAAGAQSGSAQSEFLPLPDTMPLILFAPDPLAGTMLGPLSEPQPGSPQAAVPGAGTDMPVPPIAPDAAATTATTPGVAPPAAEPGATATVEATPGATPEAAIGLPSATDPLVPSVTDPLAPPADGAVPEVLPADKSDTTITVIVENVENDIGTVNVAVCDKELSREGCPYDTAVQAAAGFVEARFDGIPPGTYAVVGYHDENGNDEFDKFFGVPREPYALSNEAAESLVPTFAEAALTINKGENVVIIRLRRFGGG